MEEESGQMADGYIPLEEREPGGDWQKKKGIFNGRKRG
jgi:hypothetical protein